MEQALPSLKGDSVTPKNMVPKNTVLDLGLLSFLEARAIQEELAKQRKASSIKDTFLLCEHPRVFTLGTQSSKEDLLLARKLSNKLSAEVEEVSRGGGLSIHEPGVLMIYPVFSLTKRKTGLRSFILLLLDKLKNELEETILNISSFNKSYADTDYGIYDHHYDHHYDLRIDQKKYSIWIDDMSLNQSKKILSVGFKLEQGITLHGISLNLTNSLDSFEHFAPCNISGSSYGSILKELEKQKIPKNIILEEISSFREKLSEIFAYI